MSQSLEQTRCKLPRVLSQGNHTGFAEFPQQRVVTTCIKCLSTREVHQRLSIHDIDWVLAIQTPSVSYIPTIQTSRRKAGVQHKPYCLHKQSGHREPLFSVQGMGGNFRKFKFPDGWSILQAGLSNESSFRPALLVLFCTTPPYLELLLPYIFIYT